MRECECGQKWPDNNSIQSMTDDGFVFNRDIEIIGCPECPGLPLDEIHRYRRGVFQSAVQSMMNVRRDTNPVAALHIAPLC